MADQGGMNRKRVMRGAADQLLTTILENEELLRVLGDVEVDRRIAAGELTLTSSLFVGSGAAVIPAAELAELRERKTALEHAVYEAQLELDGGNLRAGLRILDEVLPPVEAAEAEEEAEGEEPDGEAVAELEAGEEEPAEAAPEDEADETVVEADEPPADETEPEPAPERPSASIGPTRTKVAVRMPPAPAPGQVQQRNQTGGTPVEVDPRGRPVGMPEVDQVYSCSVCDDHDVPGLQAQLSFIRTRAVRCKPCLVRWKDPVGGPVADPAEEPIETTVVETTVA